ncbi:hypothetical protein OIU76_029130 [Salix suchowensis]|nr:hypothetical protein OIU76_029130 [Salix suchowensis]
MDLQYSSQLPRKQTCSNNIIAGISEEEKKSLLRCVVYWRSSYWGRI